MNCRKYDGGMECNFGGPAQFEMRLIFDDSPRRLSNTRINHYAKRSRSPQSGSQTRHPITQRCS